MGHKRRKSTWDYSSQPRDGISIKKHVRPRPEKSPTHVIDVLARNETDEDVVVDVTEELPNECDVSDATGTAAETISWLRSLTDDEIRVQFEVNSRSERTVTYWPGTTETSVLERICQQPFQSTNVTPADGADDSSLDGFTSSNQTRTDSKPDASKIVDEDHPYIDPPPAIDFSDVVGLHEIKREMYEEVVDPFTDPRYDEYNIGKANGVFLYGPPGTGKTHLATALAGELGYNFLTVDAANIRRSSMGEALQNLDRMFEMVEENQPCVVFLDEIDSLAPERGGSTHEARIELVNQLLTHIESINEQDANIVVVAATNRPDAVDDALLRTGRFDTQIKIGMPSSSTRLAVLEYELQQFGGETPDFWADREFMEAFVEATRNFSVSDVVEVAEAAQRASVREADADEEPQLSTDLVLEEVDPVSDQQETTAAGEFLVETPDIDFSDVGGMEETKTRLSETLLEPLESPELYDTYGLDVSNGVLLHGPPGTGKTYLSRALAGEAGCSFLPITAADIVSKWIGEAAENIQELFEKAETVAPAIIFIDEIDAIASDRGTQMANSEQQAVNELLTQITELDNNDVFVIGTTNRLDIVDSALTRAGRLGEVIEIPPPDGEGRVEILKTELAGRPVETSELDWDAIREMTRTGPGTTPYVAADMTKIADEAARYAMEEANTNDIQPIQQHHLRRAIIKTPPSLAQQSEQQS